MTIALMPGDEPIEVKFKEPDPPQAMGNPWQSGGSLSGDGGAVQGCNCPHCEQLRREVQQVHELDQRQAMMAMQYGASQRTVEAMAVANSEYPRGMPAGMIRGRYDMSYSRNPNDGFHGQVRWRQPGTMFVFDSEGRRQWTYEEELMSGTLVDRSGRRWVPDSAQMTAQPAMFDWGQVPPPLFVTDNTGVIRRSPS